MKAVIPVAGIGKRLRPQTYTSPKALVTVAGKPILGHIVDGLINMGVTELVPIIGYKGEQIREYLTSEYDMKMDFVVQTEQKGIAHAVSLTREFADSSELIIILGDTIIDTDFSRIPEAGDYVLGVREVEDPRRFGICEVSGGKITSIVEKPDDPKGNLAIVGLYYFKDSSPLYEACAHVIENDIKTKGEYQITDALSRMIDTGTGFSPYEIGDWFDCGKLETLLETNRILLEGSKSVKHGVNTVITGPCYIAEDSVIENSVIGPYVTVASGCSIRDSVISNSILNRGSSLSNVILEDSVIGAGAEVKGRKGSLNISDDSQVDLG
ncbi:MAG: NTP transferase domain-containing protein [Candidatus Krumholzibacteria bacterium]|nr:NTP transferase domain-containing protein [Candidatus Krumholzibacteria bacterium]